MGTSTMYLLFCFVFAVVYDVCQAQFGFAFQNCLGSNCNQNNLFGRKKREIAETIESLVHEQVKREAEADPQLAISNCIGSNCYTNNFFGRGKRETLELIKSVAKEMLEAE